MMFPGRTNSPPNFLSPSLLLFESRPFFDDPPAFFVAHRRSSPRPPHQTTAPARDRTSPPRASVPVTLRKMDCPTSPRIAFIAAQNFCDAADGDRGARGAAGPVACAATVLAFANSIICETPLNGYIFMRYSTPILHLLPPAPSLYFSTLSFPHPPRAPLPALARERGAPRPLGLASFTLPFPYFPAVTQRAKFATRRARCFGSCGLC